MSETDSSERLVITGRDLSHVRLVDAARGATACQLDTAGIARMAASHRAVLAAVAQGQPIYGITRGLGARADTPLDAETRAGFALNTLRERAQASGDPHSGDVVAAAMIARANTLLCGTSGADPAIAHHICACLNAGLRPRVGRVGSFGAGDIVWNATLGLALWGEGFFLASAHSTGDHQPLRPSLAHLARAGLKPPTLGPRDGLALISHNGFSAALAALAVVDARTLLTSMTNIAGLTMVAMRANRALLAPEALALRALPGLDVVGADLRAVLQGSEDAPVRLQDPLSVRNSLHVHGATEAAIDQAAQTVDAELNTSSDNPAVLWQAGQPRIISTGNFYALHLTLALEMLTSAIAHVAHASAARLTRLLSARHSGLPALLAAPGSLSNGFAPLTKPAEALLLEVRQACQSTSAALSVSADGQEDILPATPQAADRLACVVRAAARIGALEAIAAARAVHLGEGADQLGEPMRAVLGVIQSEVPPAAGQVAPMGPAIDALALRLSHNGIVLREQAERRRTAYAAATIRAALA